MLTERSYMIFWRNTLWSFLKDRTLLEIAQPLFNMRRQEDWRTSQLCKGWVPSSGPLRFHQGWRRPEFEYSHCRVLVFIWLIEIKIIEERWFCNFMYFVAYNFALCSTPVLSHVSSTHTFVNGLDGLKFQCLPFHIDRGSQCDGSCLSSSNVS